MPCDSLIRGAQLGPPYSQIQLSMKLSTFISACTAGVLSLAGAQLGTAQNLTIVRTAGRGFVTAFPGGERPLVSNINASGPDQVRAALGFTRLSGAGTETFYNGVSAKDLVVDVFGYFE